MAKYVAVLGEASTWAEHSQFAAWGKEPPRTAGHDGFRVLVNRLVQAHIKKRLEHLARAYAQMGEGLRTELNAEYRTWLEEAHKGCTGLSESLASWKRPGLIAVISPAIAIGTLLAKTPWRSVGLVLTQIAFVLGVFGVSLVVAFRDSHREKRRLFLWGYTSQVEEGEEPPRNIYRSEDELFALLRRHKPEEWTLAGAILLLYTVIGAAALAGFLFIGSWIVLVALVGTYLLATFLLVWWQRRLRRVVPHAEWR